MAVTIGDYESILSGGVGHSGGGVPGFTEVLTRGHWAGLSETYTDDYITAATTELCRRPQARVEVTWAESAIDFSRVVSSNDVNRINRINQTINGLTESEELWAYLHPGLVADNSFHPMPELDTDPNMGWYGTSLVSDGSGDFTGTEPQLKITHDARAYTQIKVAGDSEYNEYPVDFTITLTHPGGPTVIAVTGNTSRIYEADFTAIPNVTEIILDISKWSAANTVVKITEFSGSLIEVYHGDDIVNLSILEETNSDTGVVPIGNVSSNELDLSLMNTDRRFSYGNTESPYLNSLISGRKIRVWLGFVLPVGSTDVTGQVPGYIVETIKGEKVGFMPYGIYWSKDWISSYDSMVTTTTAYDIAYKLSQSDFTRSVNYSGNVITIINAVMAEAKIDVPDLEWEVSTDLAGETWGAMAFEVKNYLEILKDIAEATLSYSYVNRNGVLIIGSRLGVAVSLESYEELDLSDYFNFESEPRLDELINQVRVGFTDYAAQPSAAIFPDDQTFTIPAGETSLTVTLEWTNKPVIVSGVTLSIVPTVGTPLLTSTTIYANSGIITVTGSAGDSFTVDAQGVAYELTENTETTEEEIASIQRYGIREFALTGNRAITTLTQAQAVAAALIAGYGELRQDAVIEWPATTLITVGDTLEVVEFKSDTVETKGTFIIKRQTINFDGSLQAQAELRRG